jgi:putative transposase
MDEGFRALRSVLEYKAKLYGARVVVADRFFASSKTCSLSAIALSKRSRSQPAPSFAMIAARRLIVMKTHR